MWEIKHHKSFPVPNHEDVVCNDNQVFPKENHVFFVPKLNQTCELTGYVPHNRTHGHGDATGYLEHLGMTCEANAMYEDVCDELG